MQPPRQRREHAVSEYIEWNVQTKDGYETHVVKAGSGCEVDVEGGSLTFRDDDGQIAHAYGPGWWRSVHAQGRK